MYKYTKTQVNNLIYEYLKGFEMFIKIIVGCYYIEDLIYIHTPWNSSGDQTPGPLRTTRSPDAVALYEPLLMSDTL